MIVHEGYKNVPPSIRGGVVAIGNFDGVHRGHQALIGEAIKAARNAKLPAGVIIFEPHHCQTEPDHIGLPDVAVDMPIEGIE